MELERQLQSPLPQKRESLLAKEQLKGILLTLVLAIIAGQIVRLPFFSIMGVMIVSILLGMTWKSVMGVQTIMNPGITFSSKKLLRVGIILMGLRLNLSQIVEAGFSIILIDAIVIVFTLVVMLSLGKALNVQKHLAALIAVGTAVCGAAAIVAVAPLIKSKKEYTALAVACIAILGTVGALIYIFIYPFLGWDDYSYGVVVGATLHELAHVIAAAVPGGNVSGETAILTKLGRVALLIPVAFLMEYLFTRNEETKTQKKSFKDLPIPWFILGFLAMSVINTLGILSSSITTMLIILSVYLLSMAMAGLGLSINFSDFKQVGPKPIILGVVGTVLLGLLGPFLLFLV
ncbi:YeiH family protein [Bacillus sp. AK128]